MPDPRRGRILALLIGVALVTAACGGKTPSPTPAPVAQPAATPATPAAGAKFVYAAPVLGSANAPITIVEYGDYQ